jgi:hypothetical protein
MTYDSGDYLESQRRGLAAAGWAGPAGRRGPPQGRFIGWDCRTTLKAPAAAFESVSDIGASGQIVVATGATDQARAPTMLAQLAADWRHGSCR